jgi:hypothetical protein
MFSLKTSSVEVFIKNHSVSATQKFISRYSLPNIRNVISCTVTLEERIQGWCSTYQNPHVRVCVSAKEGTIY